MGRAGLLLLALPAVLTALAVAWLAQRYRPAAVPPPAFRAFGDDANSFSGCAWRDPAKVLVLRTPKAASTALTNAMGLLSFGRYKMVPLPEFAMGIGAVSGGRAQNPRNFIRALTKKLYKPPTPAGELVTSLLRSSGLNVTYFERDVLEGHVFLHTGQGAARYGLNRKDVGTPANVAVIGTARDPVQRLMSGYAYTRVRAMPEEHREAMLARLGNATVGACAADTACAKRNELGRLCSFHALYFCGHHKECHVRPAEDDEDGVPVATDEAVERAIANIRGRPDDDTRDRLLLVIPVDRLLDEAEGAMDGYGMLEMLLPTYFDGLREAGRDVDARDGGDYDLRTARRSGVAHRPLPEDAAERDALMHICRQDLKVYDAIREVFDSKVEQCSAERTERSRRRSASGA